jgi:hypothetical protein
MKLCILVGVAGDGSHGVPLGALDLLPETLGWLRGSFHLGISIQSMALCVS